MTRVTSISYAHRRPAVRCAAGGARAAVDTDDATGEGTFDPSEYADELAAAATNLYVGTTLWHADDRIKVWEVLLAPGERGPFHAHTRTYFWTVVAPGRGLQRFADGTYVVRDYQMGETKVLEHTPETALVHDLENVGTTPLRFVTVELLT
jgi:mannose-6-phosphate isomerase-like protein (cupin superfamily)